MLNSITETFGESGATFEIAAPIQPNGRSLGDIIAAFSMLSGVAEKFSGSGSISLVPEVRLTEFAQSLETFSARADSVGSQVKSFQRNGGVSSFDPSTFTGTAANGTAVPIKPQLVSLNEALDLLLGHFQFLAHSLKPKGTFSFQAAATMFQKLLSQLETQAAELGTEIAAIRATKEKADTNSSKIQQNLDASEDQVARISALGEEAAVQRDEIAQINATAKQAHSEVDATLAAVRKLKATVDQFSNEFAEFDGALEHRKTQFSDGEAALSALLTRLSETEAAIEQTKERSLQMLEGATVAGMASVYKNHQTTLDGKLRWATGGFALSMVLLFISAVPLIAYVAAPFLIFLNPDWASQVAEIRGAPPTSDWQYAAQVFSRLIILLPAAWLVRITTGRYNSIFKLREHYAYKYAIAASVEGFKRQAPGFEAEIAATTYAQLMHNPVADAEPTKNEVKAPNKLLELILDRMKPDDGKGG